MSSSSLLKCSRCIKSRDFACTEGLAFTLRFFETCCDWSDARRTPHAARRTPRVALVALSAVRSDFSRVRYAEVSKDASAGDLLQLRAATSHCSLPRPVGPEPHNRTARFDTRHVTTGA